MQTVLFTALAVGGATVFGVVLGFLFKGLADRFSDVVLSFAAGVMLSSSLAGLILPAFTYGGRMALFLVLSGVLLGSAFLMVVERLLPYPSFLEGEGQEKRGHKEWMGLLFVLAIAIHNLPEGIAAGVGFGTGDTGTALFIAGGIALQNLPEGMVIVAPMRKGGFSRKKTFLCAAGTGLLEIIGTFIGFFAVKASLTMLPFALSFAGGIMLYVVVFQMIPESRMGKRPGLAAFALLFGVMTVLAADHLMG